MPLGKNYYLNYHTKIFGTLGHVFCTPLAFVRSGYIDLGHNRMYNVGNIASLRSYTNGLNAAYYLASGPTGIDPSSSGVRYTGRPLRCLYPV